MNNIVTTRPDLSEVVREYSQQINNQFMATQILPVYGTPNYNDTFWKIAVGQVTKSAPANLNRAPSAPYSQVDFAVTSDSYTCEDKGLESPLDDRNRSQYEDQFDAEADIAILTQNLVLKRNEIEAASTLFNASNFSAMTSDVGTEWSSSSGTPFSDVQDTILKIKQKVGGAFGAAQLGLAVSEKVFRNMVQTTEIQNKIMGGTGSLADKVASIEAYDAQRIANILGIGKVVYSAAQDNGADVWDDEYALLFLYSDSRMLASSLQLGRTFLWTKESDVLPVVETYRSEERRSDIIRVRHDSVKKIFSYNCGYLLGNITA